jgi:hypothetical protein
VRIVYRFFERELISRNKLFLMIYFLTAATLLLTLVDEL